MKLIINESEYGTNIELKPETVEEMGQLLRMAKSSKKEKPGITVCFGQSQQPECNIWFKKVKAAKQDNALRNK